MIYDGITCESMARETGISRQLIEYWDSKYRYDAIDEVERETLQRKKKKVKKATSWHRYGSSAGRYE